MPPSSSIVTGDRFVSMATQLILSPTSGAATATRVEATARPVREDVVATSGSYWEDASVAGRDRLMIVRLDGAVELDDDPGRIDLAAVHAFLAGDDAYWIEDRSLETVRLTIERAARVLGAYDGDAQVGFARVVSDRLTFAYLDDVFVGASHRGRGIGAAMVELVLAAPWDQLNWVLFTRDAHTFYERFDFGEAPPHVMVRSRRRPDDAEG
jgi:GNAT superfamily N-acetyltransferase